MTRVRKKMGLATIFFLFVGFSSLPVYSAIRTGWSMNAMACVPTQTTVNANIALQVAGKVKFRDGQVGKITLICPLSDGPLIPETRNGKEFTVKQLTLTYKDGDHKFPGGLVSASLRFLNKKTGHVADLEGVNSNDPSAPVSEALFVTHGEPSLSDGIIPGINHTLNFLKYFYYVQITLKRTAPNIPVAVMGVTLLFG